MGLYGRAIADEHTAAIDALESCLSSAHQDVANPYKLRLVPHKDQLLEILAFFDKEEQVFEHTEVMRLIVDMFDGEYFSGFEILRHQRTIDMLRKRIKGKLMFTRSILADKDSKPGTAKKNFARFKLAEERENA